MPPRVDPTRPQTTPIHHRPGGAVGCPQGYERKYKNRGVYQQHLHPDQAKCINKYYTVDPNFKKQLKRLVYNCGASNGYQNSDWLVRGNRLTSCIPIQRCTKFQEISNRKKCYEEIGMGPFPIADGSEKKTGWFQPQRPIDMTAQESASRSLNKAYARAKSKCQSANGKWNVADHKWACETSKK